MFLLEHIDTFVRYEVDFGFNTLFSVLLVIPYMVIVYIQCYGNQNYLGFAFVLYISALITGTALSIWLTGYYMLSISGNISPVSYNSNEVSTWFTVLFFGFGIILMILGTTFFFSNATTNKESLGYNHPSISLIMWVLTAFNIFLTIFSDYKLSTNNTLLLLQALIQTGLYQFAIYPKAPKQNKRFGASWCLKFMAQYNFVLLVMQLLKTFLYLMTTGCLIQGIWFLSVVIKICYRVLCSILFIEHSVEIDYYSNNAPNNENDEDQEYGPGGVNVFYTVCGYSLGIVIVILGKSNIPWLEFLVQILVIIEMACILSQVLLYFI